MTPKQGHGSSRMRRQPLPILLACLLLSALLTSCFASPATPLTAPAPTPPAAVHVLLNDAYASPPILPNFVSFSLETYFVSCWIGHTRPRTAWLNLVRQLHASAHSRHPITFRVGGNSGDTSLYNPRGDVALPQLPGPAWQYNITDDDLRVLRAAMQQTNSQLIIGLNMRQAYNYSLATDYVRALAQHTGLDLIYAFEVGNEPDFYHSSGIRPANWTLADFAADVNRYAAAVAAALGSNASQAYYQAAAFATDEWTAAIPGVLANTSAVPYVSASAHHYPTTWCGRNPVTALQLLSDDYAQREAAFIARQRLVEQVGAQGVSFVIGEGNTASCYGAPGVSDSYASALWTLDTLFNSAAVGVAGWSFTVGGLWHDDSPYHIPVNDSAWQFRSCSDDASPVVVQPMYYAFRLFNLATADYGALLNARVNSSDAAVKVWPVHSASSGVLRVVVLHKNANATANATVTLALGVRQSAYALTASLMRMRSRDGLSGQFGVELAGQTYDGSEDGMPRGEWAAETVRREAGGAFMFKVRPLEAVMLQVGAAGAKEQPAASSRATRSTRD